MQKRHVDRALYFKELVATSEKYFLPFIEQVHPIRPGMKVLEIGCGEGGNLVPFIKRGCEVTGLDLDAGRIRELNDFLDRNGYKAKVMIADILTEYHPLDKDYDVIFVHDVIEHISDKEKLFEVIGQLSKPGGVVYIAFPAWQMPFGGHQQVCSHKLVSSLPFIHLLPRKAYRLFLRSVRLPERSIDWLCEIQECGLSVEKFHRLVRRFHYRIVKEQLYFINPHYEAKFGLKARKLSSWIAAIPFVRNFFTTSCFFLLSTSEQPVDGGARAGNPTD